MADDIAYDNHDIDDGLRAGFLSLDDLMEVDFLADQYRRVEKRFPHASLDLRLRELVRSQIGLMVNDVLEHTREQARGLSSADEVREAGKQLAGFSPELADQERALKKFMYQRLYYHPEQIQTAERARDVIARLFVAYQQDPTTMPDDWLDRLPSDEPGKSRHIADFIAGMTDRFAIDQCTQIYGRAPQGLSNV